MIPDNLTATQLNEFRNLELENNHLKQRILFLEGEIKVLDEVIDKYFQVLTGIYSTR